MKSNETTLTKSEFIKRSMAGERFMVYNLEYYYDEKEDQSPFRCGNDTLLGTWNCFDGKTIFTIVTPKKTIVLEEWLVRHKLGSYEILLTSSIDAILVEYARPPVKIQKLSERTIEVDV